MPVEWGFLKTSQPPVQGAVMSVRKRKWVTSRGEAKEAFIVDYVDQEGHRHIRTFDRKGEATEYAATVRVDIAKGVHTASKLTVAEAADAWVKRVESEGAERRTMRHYRGKIRLKILHSLGRTKISGLWLGTM